MVMQLLVSLLGGIWSVSLVLVCIQLCFLVSLQRYTKALTVHQRSTLVERSRQKPQEKMTILTDVGLSPVFWTEFIYIFCVWDLPLGFVAGHEKQQLRGWFIAAFLWHFNQYSIYSSRRSRSFSPKGIAFLNKSIHFFFTFFSLWFSCNFLCFP